MKTKERADIDTPWKQVLEVLFKQCLEFCYPSLADDIDWSYPIKSLEKELLKMHPYDKLGKRIPDKLFEVRLSDGETVGLLVHVEIQSQKDEEFGKRMFWYNTQIKQRFGLRVVSIAILADAVKTWMPNEYTDTYYRSYTKIGFLSVKLLEYQHKQSMLLASNNPFAFLILIHLAKYETKGNINERLKRKIALAKACQQRGWHQDVVISVLRFLEWILVLPSVYELKYEEEMYKEDKTMQLCSFEVKAMERGLQQGLEQGIEKGKHEGQAKMLGHLLERRFDQSLSAETKAKLHGASLGELERWADRVLTAKTLEEVFA